MHYLYIFLALVYGGGAGYVGYAYGRRVEAAAQQVKNVLKKL